jgi:hypothetical protein
LILATMPFVDPWIRERLQEVIRKRHAIIWTN